MTTTTTRPAYLSLQTVAKQYAVSVKTLRRMIAAGTLPAYRVGGQVRILEVDAAELARPIPSAAVR